MGTAHRWKKMLEVDDMCLGRVILEAVGCEYFGRHVGLGVGGVEKRARGVEGPGRYDWIDEEELKGHGDEGSVEWPRAEYSQDPSTEQAEIATFMAMGESGATDGELRKNASDVAAIVGVIPHSYLFMPLRVSPDMAVNSIASQSVNLSFNVQDTLFATSVEEVAAPSLLSLDDIASSFVDCGEPENVAEPEAQAHDEKATEEEAEDNFEVVKNVAEAEELINLQN
ncbi:hypothetical protein FQN50_008956 [Emmonsiellopsis sp. PD_5]|nr:hypothetical protein FQN50_008956 [Emmonsiellopsis sp. PD_5]